MKLFWDISPSLILKEKVPLCQPHHCHCEHRHFLPLEDVCLCFSFFSLAQPWSLSLFSLRGCEQKAIKPLQSLVRDRYRNERWRDRKDAWAATHFTLKWGNEWLSEWGKEGKKDGHGGVLAGKEKRKSMWFIRWGERECETCKCLIVGACLKITECSDEKWE